MEQFVLQFVGSASVTYHDAPPTSMKLVLPGMNLIVVGKLADATSPAVTCPVQSSKWVIWDELEHSAWKTVDHMTLNGTSVGALFW